MRLGAQLMTLCLGTLILAGCDRPRSTQDGVAGCQVYRPHIAKSTFDGRVGSVLLRNGSAREIEVKVYHPDGMGEAELRRRVSPGAVLVLEGPDGGRLALGNDWGIQVEQSCVTTLGQSAQWAPGEFSLRWEEESLRPGLDSSP